MTLRFVHAADLHLDSPFTGIRATAPENVAQALYSATFDSYQNIVDLCISERVDALLVAGDIYDGRGPQSARPALLHRWFAQSGLRGYPVIRVPRQPRSTGWVGSEAGIPNWVPSIWR